MEWNNAKERLPELPDGNNYETFLVAVYTGSELETLAMDYRRTQVRGKTVERWEWNNRISPWDVLHWMPLPAPPIL